jgi:beta-lactamase class A
MLDAAQLSQSARRLSARAAPGLLNLGVMDIGQGRVWRLDEAGHYPLAGLSKLPAAAAALALADAGRLRLNQRVRLTAQDAGPPPSRLNRLVAGSPGGAGIETPLADLLGLSIQHDDSTAGDAVLRLAGGPGAVTDWLRARGVEGVRIDRYDRAWIPQMVGLGDFLPTWSAPAAFAEAIESVSAARRQSAMDDYLADPRDTATALGMLSLLGRLAAGTLISAESTRFLTALMRTRARADEGLAEGLPAGAALAAMGATTPTSVGFTPADNAAGFAVMPDGRRLAMAVFIAGSTATAAARRRLTADAARLLCAAPSPSTA